MPALCGVARLELGALMHQFCAAGLAGLEGPARAGSYVALSGPGNGLKRAFPGLVGGIVRLARG